MKNPELTVYMAAPRGFCAGVDRAIKIVEMALEKWGEPVYVRHEIVHNKYVVDELKSKGAIFIKEVRDAPVDRPIIFSAHGVPKSVFQNAKKKLLSKNCDYLVLNFPTTEDKIFNSKYNNGILIGRSGDFLNLGNVSKTIFANKIIKYISNRENLSG